MGHLFNYAISLNCMAQFLAMLHTRATIMMTAAAFLKNGSFAEQVLWDISGACVDSKLKQLASPVVIEKRPCVSLYCEQRKLTHVVASK